MEQINVNIYVRLWELDPQKEGKRESHLPRRRVAQVSEKPAPENPLGRSSMGCIYYTSFKDYLF